MPVQLQKKFFTVEEYHLMGEAGILSKEDCFELIEGEIIQMSAIGTRHASCVRRLLRQFSKLSEENAIVDVQNPIQLTQWTQPQPDIVLLQPHPDYYLSAHPTPNNVLLLVEVADSSVDYDRDVKIPIYARSGIQEVWLIDLDKDCIEVYRQPTLNGYDLIQKFRRTQQVSPLAFPDFTVNVDFILGSIN
jgi:Uma2 family endonuclease